MNLSNLLAWKYLWNINSKGSLSTVAIISFLSIALSTASLALVTSIMNGFEVTTKQKIQGINPELISAGKICDKEKIHSVEGVEHVAIQANENVLICEANQTLEFADYALIKGIDIPNEQLVTKLVDKFTNLIGPIDLLEKEYVLIGKNLAECKCILPGNKIELCVPQVTKKQKLNLDKISVTVLGLIDTGISDYDDNLIICSLETLKKLYKNPKISYGLKVKSGYDFKVVQTKLKDIGCSFKSWQDLYPALFSALELEKYATFAVLALILLIATVNIIALIFMVITQKKRDIAILKAMGFPTQNIKKIFIIFGGILITTSTTIGLGLAWLAGTLLERYPFIKLPDVYYTTTLPIKMSFQIFIAVFCLAIFLGFCAIAVSLKELKNLNAIKTLKFEI